MKKSLNPLKQQGLINEYGELNTEIKSKMTAAEYISACIKEEVEEYSEDELDIYADVPDNFVNNCNRVTIRTNKYASKLINSGFDVTILTRTDFVNVINSGDKTKIMCSEGTILNSGDECIIGGLNKHIVDSGIATEIVSVRDSASIICTGYNPMILSTGDSADIICNGNVAYVNSEGKDAKIVCNGYACTVKAKLGSTITLSECRRTKEGEFCYRKTEVVDGVRIKEDKWYQLRGNEFVETIPGQNDEICCDEED